MKWMPYDGGTFEDMKISEEGRRLLGDRLKQLPRAQIEALFHRRAARGCAAVGRRVRGQGAADCRPPRVPVYDEDFLLTILPLSTVSPIRLIA